MRERKVQWFIQERRGFGKWSFLSQHPIPTLDQARAEIAHVRAKDPRGKYRLIRETIVRTLESER